MKIAALIFAVLGCIPAGLSISTIAHDDISGSMSGITMVALAILLWVTAVVLFVVHLGLAWYSKRA